ncbi:hypothetical protein [Halogeometricum borinquense]|uniref:hypothetical protein n=1 Tax=Halogeometricum borinquense TaxID=60847 RepID=UPI0034498B18
MSERQTSEEHTNQDATDSEIFAVLRRVKEEDGIPALVTSQFNDIWEYDYSNEGLHKRLMALHEDGILGHMKASNRHFWWLSSEGETGDTSVSSLEELVHYDDLPAERFTEEKAREIAAEKIPGFKKNAWERMIETGDSFMRAGILVFFLSLGIFSIEQNFIPQPLVAVVLFLGMVFITFSGGYYLVGFIGGKAQKAGYTSAEPFNEKTLFRYVWDQLQGSEQE